MSHEQTERVAEDVQREFEEKRSEAKASLSQPVERLSEGVSEDDSRSDEQLMVRDVMTASPVSMRSDAAVVDAARAMIAENVGSLPVVDEGALVGMVTDRDLVVNVMARDLDPNKVPVSECCSDDLVVANPDESLDVALQRMAEAQVRRLPVVDDDRLVGIVAQADIARAARPESTGEMVQEISRG
jgi:CBS domain-containing protein